MLLAVHIGEDILKAPWSLGGFVFAGLLLWLATWRLRDEEIPRIALLTAALFISSSIHIRLGPTSIHLLLNGLAGVLLGKRAPLAIVVGLLLQAILLQHGGYTSLGINTCILSLPALFSFGLFQSLKRLPWRQWPRLRLGLIGSSIFLWLLCVEFCLCLLWGMIASTWDEPLSWFLHHPATIGANLVLTFGLTFLWNREKTHPAFPLGMLVGIIAVLLTVAINGSVLLLGSKEASDVSVLLLMIAHLPVAAIESLILGFVVGFLMQVKPDLLRADRSVESTNPCTDPFE